MTYPPKSSYPKMTFREFVYAVVITTGLWMLLFFLPTLLFGCATAPEPPPPRLGEVLETPPIPPPEPKKEEKNQSVCGLLPETLTVCCVWATKDEIPQLMQVCKEIDPNAPPTRDL